MKKLCAVVGLMALVSGCSALGVKGIKTSDVLDLVSKGAECADQANAAASSVKAQVPACMDLSAAVKGKLQ